MALTILPNLHHVLRLYRAQQGDDVTVPDLSKRVVTGTLVAFPRLLPLALFDSVSGADGNTGSCRRRLLSKPFISLSHIKVDLSDVERHNLSMKRRTMTLRLQTGQSNCRLIIHNVAERKEAANRKMLALLTFLKEETYSDFKTLKKVVGFKGNKSPPNVCATE